MTTQELLRLQAQAAYGEFLESIEGVTQELAWAYATLQPGEYLHSEGSILSLVVHLASCKFMYGSSAFRDLQIRWRDVTAQMEALWPDWEAAKRWCQEAQDYWLASWEQERDFERMVDAFQGREIPSWKAIWTVTNHEGYHAGQIQLLRATLQPSSTPPPAEGDLWRKYCEPLPSW